MRRWLFLELYGKHEVPHLDEREIYLDFTSIGLTDHVTVQVVFLDAKLSSCSFDAH